jgi:hypothetical protein
MCSSSARSYPPPGALTRALPARPGHARQQLARAHGVRAELQRTGPQMRGQVVVVALEEAARDPELRGERVQLLEGRVGDEVRPVPERQARVRVLALRVAQAGPPRPPRA